MGLQRAKLRATQLVGQGPGGDALAASSSTRALGIPRPGLDPFPTLQSFAVDATSRFHLYYCWQNIFMQEVDFYRSSALGFVLTISVISLIVCPGCTISNKLE